MTLGVTSAVGPMREVDISRAIFLALAARVATEFEDAVRAEAEDDNFMRHWTTDAGGQRVRVGFTAAETAEYEGLIKAYRDGERGSHDRYSSLQQKHEWARMAVVMAENELRVDEPTRQ